MKTMVPLLLLASACAADDPIDPATCDAPRVYRIDTVTLPASTRAAREMAFDLDGDGVVDNQLGQVSGYLIDKFSDVPLDLMGRANAHLATDTDWRIEIADCGDVDRRVAIDRAGVGIALPGTSFDGVVGAKGSDGGVPLVALFDGTGTVSSQFTPAEHTELQLAETDGELTGLVGFAIGHELAVRLVVHAMAGFLVEHDDPFGMDADGDGTLTETEIATNSLAQAVLGADVQFGGVDSISLALEIHATRM